MTASFHLACFPGHQCSHCQYFIPFYGWVISHCMDIPFIYPFVSRGTLGLCLLLSYYESFCEEHSCVSFWCRHLFSFLLGRQLGVKLLSHTVSLCLSILGPARLSLKQLLPPAFTSRMGFNASIPLLTFVCLPYYYHDWGGCKAVFHCGFALHFLD